MLPRRAARLNRRRGANENDRRDPSCSPKTRRASSMVVGVSLMGSVLTRVEADVDDADLDGVGLTVGLPVQSQQGGQSGPGRHTGAVRAAPALVGGLRFQPKNHLGYRDQVADDGTATTASVTS